MKYRIANWKMNFEASRALKFIEELKEKDLHFSKNKIILCPSFTSLSEVNNIVSSVDIELGAQNVHHRSSGSFTGDISASMLIELECEWVILGHSERRQFYPEEDIFIKDKVETAIESGLKPILCIGEDLTQRNNNETIDFLKHQIDTALSAININNSDLIVAYEPIWAIGTGKSASIEIIDEVTMFIDEYLLQKFSVNIPILYGGSVTSANAKEIIDINNVDGFLIGSASLDVKEFYQIYTIMNER